MLHPADSRWSLCGGKNNLFHKNVGMYVCMYAYYWCLSICQVGASLGGAIAINLATEVCPELVDKVILLDAQVVMDDEITSPVLNNT